jgi:hypothetical protein
MTWDVVVNAGVVVTGMIEDGGGRSTPGMTGGVLGSRTVGVGA